MEPGLPGLRHGVAEHGQCGTPMATFNSYTATAVPKPLFLPFGEARAASATFGTRHVC